MSYISALAKAVVIGLKENAFPHDDKHWGLGVEFQPNNIILLAQFLDEIWVEEVLNLVISKARHEPNPELRIQYINDEFHVYLECNIGKYKPESGHTVKVFSEDNLVDLIKWIISNDYIIYPQYGENIFPQ